MFQKNQKNQTHFLIIFYFFMTLLPYFIALKFSLSESTTSPKNRDIYNIFSVLGETESLRAQLALTGFIPSNHEVYFQEKDERTLYFFLSFCQKIDKVNDATTLWVYFFQKSYELEKHS
jgi:hypothetical protein